ncbi:hypothetical protein EBQ74_01980 [bacterium]|nr:hypothetical protein [bacterium]
MIEKNDHSESNLRVNYVPVNSKLNWDEYFMLQAMLASYKSKDPNTKVGCVIVDEHHHQISMGYNGTIAGIDETLIPWGNNREVPLEHQKYGYVFMAKLMQFRTQKGTSPELGLRHSFPLVTNAQNYWLAIELKKSSIFRISMLKAKKLESQKRSFRCRKFLIDPSL